MSSTKHKTRRWLTAAACGALIAAGISQTPQAHADENQFFNILAANGMITWDYPATLTQGRIICQLLWEDINPYIWLTAGVGYDPTSASILITSAQQGLCPGNAVGAPAPEPPPQLIEAT